ncbi:MAG TPA: patatin-like phospholipase family protein [Candidatus Krumholzibacteria bacterium]|nr:patatin-like phospholipase family protein [Candidatus Krumholzibacteria bacterium]
MNTDARTKIGLVLGSGGARGYAHIGVLRAIEKRGLEVTAIAGCSMGGIIGALHAAGYSSQRIHEMWKTLDPLKLIDRSTMGGLIGGRGITRHLEQYLPRTFEELKIPVAVTSVDVQRGKLVVLRSGDLPRALRATSAVAGVFAPEPHEGRILVDGGILNGLPVDVIRTLTRAPVVAVDTTPPADREIAFTDDRSTWEKVRHPIRGRPLVFEMLMKAIEIPQAPLTSIRLSLNPPEVLIRPALEPDLKLEDYRRLDEAVEAGFVAAEAKLAEHETLLRESQ